MRPSGPISLFSERSQFNPPTTPFFLSVLAHGAVIGLIAAVIVMRPRVIVEPFPEQLAVRHLDLHMPDPPIARPKDLGIKYPGPQQPHPAAPKLKAEASAKPAVARQVAQLKPAPQTLLQPKLPKMVLPEKLPLPTVVLWKMDSKQPRVIIPPQPAKPVVAAVQPSVEPPNNEINLDKLAVSSSPKPSLVQPILPSNTSPLVVLAQQQAVQAPPETTSKGNAPPTPATVVSLSDLRKDGDVALPPANQTASASSSGLIAPGRPDEVGQADHGGAGRGDSASGNKPEGAGGKADALKGGGGKQDVAVGQAALSDSGATSSVEKIVLPKDGQFAAVVVGSSLEETYPEAAELWAGRLAYTVYLHVGLAKSWILQYALPRTAEASNGGNAAHLAAPWPYTIIRPNLSLDDLNADALMIHGRVNANGHFEALAIAFPSKFPQAEFVLSSLKQWEFRPASQGGQATAVEVLLIIPEESE